MKRRSFLLHIIYALMLISLALVTSSCDVLKQNYPDIFDEITSDGTNGAQGTVSDKIPGLEEEELLEFDYIAVKPISLKYTRHMIVPPIQFDTEVPDFATVTVGDYDHVYDGAGFYQIPVTISAEGYRTIELCWDINVTYPEILLWNSATPPTFRYPYTGETYYVYFDTPDDIEDMYGDVYLEYVGNGHSEVGAYKIEVIPTISILRQKLELDHIFMELYIMPYHTINFDPAGGDCDLESMDVLHGEAILSLNLPTPTRHGYTFAYWDTDELFVTEGITLTARWNIDEYSIEYDAAGGAESTNPTSYNITTEKIVLAKAERRGYIFEGWYDAPEGGNPVTEIDPKKELKDIKLYAHWSIKDYSITYHSDKPQEDLILPLTYSYNILSYPITNLSERYAYYPGFDFDGWYLDPTYQTKVEVINPEDYLCDLDLYGRYVPTTYTVTYDLDGGTNHPDNPTEFTVFDGNITLKAPTREGYDFAGWVGGYYNDTGFDYVFMIEPEHATPYKLKAKWVPSSDTPDCFVIFRLDGVGYFESGENSITYTKGSGDIYLSEPKRDGYIFGGWYTGPSLEYKVEFIPEGYFGKWNLRPLWIPIS